jgi:hypothetical protein
MMPHSVDAYLGRLRREAQLHKSMNARVVDEAREHLLDAIDAGLQRGLSIQVAEYEAFARFGDPNQIGDEFRRLYRWDSWFWHLGKIALAAAVSVVAALTVQLFINLRFSQSQALSLSPDFSQAAIVSVTIVVGLVGAWEICRKPFDWWRAGVAAVAFVLIWVFAHGLFTYGWLTFMPGTLLILVGYLCTRFDRRPARLALLFVAYSVIFYAGHSGKPGVMQSLTESIGLFATWTLTVTVLARLDHAFLDTSI